MFKRLFWLIVGVGFGFGLAFWLMRAVRSTIERYRPERLGSDLAGAVRAAGSDLKAAMDAGVAAMRQREQELRSELTPRS
jgi:hypothetical protein